MCYLKLEIVPFSVPTRLPLWELVRVGEGGMYMWK